MSWPPFSPGLGERMTSHALQICQGVVVTQLKEWTRPSLPRGQASYTCQSPQQSPMPHFCWLRRSECCHPTCKDLQAGCWAAGLACQLSWVIVCCVALCNSVKKLAVPAVHLAGSLYIHQYTPARIPCFKVLCVSCLCQAVRSWHPCRKSLGQRPKPVSPRKEDRFGRDLDVRGYSPVRGSGPQEQQVRCCTPLEQLSSL